ncbi:hypothetical protein, partial [Gluconacetobacter azotocaptans]|uniref:hypothetical protein n=1 Tax=Gluconacetobacter azotocaptans TaxID=142834 RepID=UPI0022327809
SSARAAAAIVAAARVASPEAHILPAPYAAPAGWAALVRPGFARTHQGLRPWTPRRPDAPERVARTSGR